MPHPDDFDYVEAEVNLNIIDAVKLDEQAKLARKATQIAKEAELANRKMMAFGNRGILAGGQPLGAGRLGKIKQQKDPYGKLFGLFEDKQHLQQKLSQLDEKLDGLEGKINQFAGMAGNPMGFISSKIMKSPFLRSAGKIGAIILATKMAYDIIMGMIKSFFEPGSVYDIRKKVLEATKSLPELAHLIEIRKGNVFFTADTRISQTAAEGTYGERFRDAEMRHIHLNLGSELGSH